ncbi:hypothetical protein [Streptomyces violaceorubidus]|uniref:Uncharacterized protein n=1 Tax=Streptomyces violaceorubidus TaxID=284042 RepID=A0ABV1SV56_9ACTN
MNKELAIDADAAVRHARFGKLPERIRYEDMTTLVQAAPGGGDTYTPEHSWKVSSCVALDLGL